MAVYWGNDFKLRGMIMFNRTQVFAASEVIIDTI